MLWIKALHILAVISWMAGLLYLPRLFVNHVEHQNSPSNVEMLKNMERKLYKIIMQPAMMVAWVCGLLLVYIGQNWTEPWLWLKLICVVALTVYHIQLGSYVEAFGRDDIRRTSRYFRILNEVPTLLMIAIVILVVVQPF